MSASEKIILPGLLRAELEALANRLLAENAALKRVSTAAQSWSGRRSEYPSLT
jgi:hypothetical protein